MVDFFLQLIFHLLVVISTEQFSIAEKYKDTAGQKKKYMGKSLFYNYWVLN